MVGAVRGMRVRVRAWDERYWWQLVPQCSSKNWRTLAAVTELWARARQLSDSESQAGD